jgi:predicted ATPase with chaperone activity
VPAVLPAAPTATNAEITTIAVATANQAEAGLVTGLTVIAADNLAEIGLAAARPPAILIAGRKPLESRVPGPAVRCGRRRAGRGWWRCRG